jgi:hypothetical protein
MALRSQALTHPKIVVLIISPDVFVFWFLDVDVDDGILHFWSRSFFTRLRRSLVDLKP